FNKWTLGEAFCTQDLGLDPAQLDDVSFDLLATLGFTPAEVEAAGNGNCAKAGCMKTIASKTGADYIVRTVMTIADRDYTVTVELYDAEGNLIVTSSDGCEICGVADVGTLLDAAAATLRSKLEALDSGPASVTVTSTPEGADVTLDGQPFGVTPLDKSIIPGDHTIMVSKDGYISVQEKRTFVEGTRESLSYALDKVPNRLPKRPYGWAALSIGVLSLGGAVATATAIHGKLPYRRNNACDQADPSKYDAQGDCVLLWDTMAASLP
ncbi:MAG: PEGA domain-containing protein, partial [Myxococcales bacterium]|nr:PEGA domain-containing protein [Myxococcales bacterium]